TSTAVRQFLSCQRSMSPQHGHHLLVRVLYRISNTFRRRFQMSEPHCLHSTLPELIPGPADASIGANMQEATKHSGKLLWFYNQVHNKAPWDYKQKSPMYQDFGNFNYGATGAAASIPDQVLLRAAGIAQMMSGNTSPAFGYPWRAAPYGDDPADQ